MADDPHKWGDRVIGPGESAAINLPISESYYGADVRMVVFVERGVADGPTFAVTAAVHGDEINGTGAIRKIIQDREIKVEAGTLVLVPVVNVVGFERHSRYLPDRRDLNRCFPGTMDGSLASRMAKSIFDQVIRRSDYCVDLHTAAVRRTNFPNIRVDLKDQRAADLARAFGACLVVGGRGPEGCLRRSACEADCAAIILEAGEVWKVEPTVVEYIVRGIRNCLVHLGMMKDTLIEPPFRVVTDATKWVRATHGGFLQFHVSPGQIVAKGDAIATNSSLTGEEHNPVFAPREGIVLGMTTLPAVAPGDPIVHLAFPKRGALKKMERAISSMDDESLDARVKGDLSRSFMVTDAEGDTA